MRPSNVVMTNVGSRLQRFATARNASGSKPLKSPAASGNSRGAYASAVIQTLTSPALRRPAGAGTPAGLWVGAALAADAALDGVAAVGETCAPPDVQAAATAAIATTSAMCRTGVRVTVDPSSRRMRLVPSEHPRHPVPSLAGLGRAAIQNVGHPWQTAEALSRMKRTVSWRLPILAKGEPRPAVRSFAGPAACVGYRGRGVARTGVGRSQVDSPCPALQAKRPSSSKTMFAAASAVSSAWS